MADSKLLGNLAHDPLIHDIYNPKEDEKLSLRKTVKNMMMMMPLKKKPSRALVDEAKSEAPGEPAHPRNVSRFPVHRVKHAMMKNSQGKDVLALTVAANLLYKGESSRRRSILNNKPVSVNVFLQNIRSLVLDAPAKGGAEDAAGQDEAVAEVTEVTEVTPFSEVIETNRADDDSLLSSLKDLDDVSAIVKDQSTHHTQLDLPGITSFDVSPMRVEVSVSGRLSQSAHPTSRSTGQTTARSIISRGLSTARSTRSYDSNDDMMKSDISFDVYDASDFMIDDDADNSCPSSPSRRQLSAQNQNHDKTSPFRRKTPTIRVDNRDVWKYQLCDELSVDSYSSGDGSLMSNSMTVSLKPKTKSPGGNWSKKRPPGSPDVRSHSPSLVAVGDEEGAQEHDVFDQSNDSNLMDFFQAYEDENGLDLHARPDTSDLLSTSSSLSSASTMSFIKRLQSPEQASGIPTSSMEKKYAMKAHLKMVADQLTESLGINPQPINKRPALHLYNRDGSARRSMSSKFYEISPDDFSHHPNSSSKSGKFSPQTRSPNTKKKGYIRKPSRSLEPLSPQGAAEDSRHRRSDGGRLPAVIPRSGRHSPGSAMSPISVLRLPPRSANTTINDSDIETIDTLGDCDNDFDDDFSHGSSSRNNYFNSPVFSRSKIHSDPTDTLLGRDAQNENNVFLQEGATSDTFSWIRDMPRYIRDTGHVKPGTLRAMSKSCRLGNFVVDEPLDLKEF
jgi:hypothetical protein